MASAERVSIGFSGGGMFPVSWAGDERSDGWFDLEAEEGFVAIDLRQVVFIRSATTPQRIGFGG